jgi:hypothetical protein
MTNRYHLPLVVTTADELDRDETIEYVERILGNLEESEDVYRTYVEDSSIDEGEAERLLEMLSRVDTEDLSGAVEAMDTIADNE